MKMVKPLFESLFFSLSYDDTHNWLHAEWQGTHDAVSSLASCAVIMEHLQVITCSRLLCDSSLAYDGWSEIGQWMSTNYLPRLADAGIIVIAWVNAKDWSTNAVIEDMLLKSNHPIIATFDEGLHAYDWLLRYPIHARKEPR
jgi:hypothetical protein